MGPLVLALALVLAELNSKTTNVTVPFSYFHHEVILSARLGLSRPFNFLLDTDTSPSAIDAALAWRLHLRTNGASGRGSGVGSNKTVATPVIIPYLSVGRVHAKNLQALTTDLSGISKHFGRPIAGVLGTSFLRDRVTEFNYPCRTIVFLADAPGEKITARFHGEHENIVDVALVNGHHATATLDTGNAGAIFVTARGIANLNLAAAEKRGRTSTGYGYNGAAAETLGQLDDVRVGSIDFGKSSATFIPSADSPYDINIGNRSMEHYRVIFDYGRNLVTFLRPAPDGCAQ